MSKTMRSIFIGLALITTLGLAACGGGGSSSPGNPTVGPTVAPTAAPTVAPTSGPTTSPTTAPVSDATLPQQVTVGGQKIWETKAGLPLYEFSGDTAGVSNCTGGCAAIWPPLMSGATSKPVGDFTIITRSNPSGSQWAYLGKALYTFASDTAGQPPTGVGIQGFSLALVAGQAGAPTPPPACKGNYC
jgi:predicted lipoprotein with Yx(FWY)xxD motif